METVTPISSQESQQFQQEIISQASRAVQILLESLKQAGNKTTEQQQKEKLEQQKDNRDDNSKNQFKITIGGKDKAPEQLTWEDYGKLQACSQQDIGDNNLALADIKVLQISSDKKEIPLLETNPQGTVLTNVSKQSSPPNLTASQAVNQALNKLGKSPVKDYLLEVNQQLTQQLQQQQKLLQECQQFNLQLTQQLNQNQSVTEKSQSINQQQAQLIQNYQQLYQQRDKKDPQWWSKVGTQLNKTVNQVNAQVGQVGHKFGQAGSSLNQWWQQRNKQIKKQNNDQKSSSNLRYFAKEMMGTFDENQKIYGDKYDLEKEGDFYKLTSKQGAVLLNFQDQGVLGTKIIASNLNSQQRKDIRQLGQFRKDPLFLQKNSQFFSNPSPPVSDFSQKPPQNTPKQQLYQDFDDIFKGLKYISQKLGKDINETNRDGFNIKTSDGGKGILLTRHGGGLVAVKNKTGEIEIPKYSTFDDANNLKQLVNKAVLKVNQSSQNKLNDVKFSKGR